MSSIGSMNSVINNNRKLLKNRKREPFTKPLGGYSKTDSYKPYKLPEVSPHVLRRIRVKTQRANRRLFIKQLVFGVIIGSIVFYGFYRLQYG